MNSIEITEKLNKELVDYLTTVFDVNKAGDEDDLAFAIRESFMRPGALSRGPFLELILPYKMGVSINQLVQEGVLSQKLTRLASFSLENPEPIPLNAALYLHQEQAIRKLCAGEKSIVISSGTGSGKTEGFLIPIINDLLNDETPGVRAILIYPLNALVNDQLDRLRVLLKGTKITFGRYTGELPEDADRNAETLPNEIISRKEIHKEGRIPQILITNYAMLEYLLLRPDDSPIFESGKWRFLVLDEAHTYSGAQGIEVAMLMRRLKQRLGTSASGMQCIATSATLVNNDAEAAVNFAGKLLHVEIDKEDIIFGEANTKYYEESKILNRPVQDEAYLDPKFPNLLEELRKEERDTSSILLSLIEIGILEEEILDSAPQKENDIPEFLFEELSKNAELIRLRGWMQNQNRPVEVAEAADFVFPNLDEINRHEALYHLVELGSLIRPGKNRLPILPAKYHLFVRPPQGIWVCINPKCSGKNVSNLSRWSYVYTSPHKTCESCGAKVYPIGLCRQCGQVFLFMQQIDNTFEPAGDQLIEGGQRRFFTWKKIQENLALGFEDEEQDVEDEEEVVQSTNEFIICLNCGKELKFCNCDNQIKSIPLFCIQKKATKKRKNEEVSQISPADELQKCPRCHTSAKKGTEIVTPITASGTTILSNLAYELYRQLPPSNKKEISAKPGGGRKLLTFYDSRQGAARFAAFLQDSCNSQNYRHIVPKAIQSFFQEKRYAPSIDSLSNKCMDLAWEYRVIQNDPDSSFWRTNSKRFSREERDKSKSLLLAQILGEFTTGSRSRQSLEQMGFAGIDYFEDDSMPDFDTLSSILTINSQKARTLVSYLLDEARFQKIIKLPNGIYPDDPNFGGNPSDLHLIRQGKTKYGEICWVGATARQRRRKYIELVLATNKLDSSEQSVMNSLTNIWDWLVGETDILIGSPENGYQLNPDRFFFKTGLNWYRCTKCMRLFYRGDSLPCPFPNCGGKLEQVNIQSAQKDNYFYNLFQKDLIPVRVEEHTAQLDPEKGREYQDNFKNGNINILSCSTTFEMGIDLGDLQTVLLSNVPPTVANYRQRAGRAGRRTSETAFILTWAGNRPHDQSYYDKPIEIISGNVAVPRIVIENEIILNRHINAILLSSFLRYVKRVSQDNLSRCGDFFDYDVLGTPHFEHLNKWSDEEKLVIEHQLKKFAELVDWNREKILQLGLANFINSMTKLNNENYQPIIKYYNEQIEDLGEKSKDPTLKAEAAKRISYQQDYFRKLRERMRNELLIDYLSNKGVLPSYSFPLHTVELLLPPIVARSEHLRLERDLRQAIREYAPGSEIVADKRIWKSLKPIFWKDTVRDREYKICESCQNLTVGKEAGIPLKVEDGKCSVCGEPIRKIKRFVEPDGFFADPKSGKPAKQYVNVEPSQMRSALLPMQNLDEQQLGDLIFLAYDRRGELLYVNEGKSGLGFKLSLSGFNLLSEEGVGKPGNYSLGFIQTTDTLHIRFKNDSSMIIPGPADQSFWLSLMYAIIQAASHYLQIERKDIDGVLSPRKLGNAWEQTIVLYDNVPGGAGHVKNIQLHFAEILQEAVRVLNCDDCGAETSCYHCLRDYNNQYFHHLLKRDNALKFVELLVSDLSPLESNIPNACRVISPNLNTWLLRQIEDAHFSLDLALEEIEPGHPWGDNYLWLDTLHDLVHKSCKVNLYLLRLPNTTAQDLSFSKYLQVLMSKGLKVWMISEMPKTQIVIDKENIQDARAIWSETDKNIRLSTDLNCESLLTTVSPFGVSEAYTEMMHVSRKSVAAEQFNPPLNTKVINIQSQRQGNINEEKLFGEIFSMPIKKVLINDPYLLTREQIIDRLGAYVKMAVQHSSLEKISVITRSAQPNLEQIESEKRLIRMYGDKIEFKHIIPEHDRYLIITRTNGEKVRILIGRGLDFIQSDGSVLSTYVVIEDPWVG